MLLQLLLPLLEVSSVLPLLRLLIPYLLLDLLKPRVQHLAYLVPLGLEGLRRCFLDALYFSHYLLVFLEDFFRVGGVHVYFVARVGEEPPRLLHVIDIRADHVAALTRPTRRRQLLATEALAAHLEARHEAEGIAAALRYLRVDVVDRLAIFLLTADVVLLFAD